MKDFSSILKTFSTPLEKVEDEILIKKGINLFIKREDLNDPEISGNKLHKLKYNLIYARESGYDTLLTFGGAYSNHIFATAAAGKRFGFNTIGVIRGEEHLPLNPTLDYATKNGMKLVFMNRTLFRQKNSNSVLDKLREEFGSFYMIPEGGTNLLALKGCSEIVNGIDIQYDYICTASGTGGTLAGLAAGLDNKKRTIGFAVLKGAGFLNENVRKLLGMNNSTHISNWEIQQDYHFGGYAKFDKRLIEFADRFYSITGIRTEPIYTGKMLFGIYDLIGKNYFPEGSTIIALHTGGLQGLEGLRSRNLLK